MDYYTLLTLACVKRALLSLKKREIKVIAEMFFVQRDGTGVFSQFAIIWWLHLQFVMFFVKVWSCTGHL